MSGNERNIRLVIEYEGTAYAGWQIQNDQRTIQGEITRAIHKVTGCDVKLLGAGRTDAGVHALAQVANFRIDHTLPADRFAAAINYYLDDDIRVNESSEVPHEFHARFDALSKRYRYLIGLEPSALYRNLRWAHTEELDVDLLRRAARLIVGEHDFAPFCVTSSRKPNNTCTIHSARWRIIGKLLVFEIHGNRFLHNMVRRLVGAMSNLAQVRPDRNILNLTLDGFGDILGSPTEEQVVFTAPARGLYLVSVNYSKGSDS
jgi:tRNA pseudouridine38-40 synthase